MVQMPVDPSRNWKTLQSTKWGFLNFNPNPSWWDEDLARCFLQYQLKQGAILRVKIDTNDNNIISLDGKLVKGSHNEAMIKDIITPLREEMQIHITKDGGSAYRDSVWYSSIPGVTKIKIYMKCINFSSKPDLSGVWFIKYVIKHIIGRNGGKNYHITGVIKSLKKDE